MDWIDGMQRALNYIEAHLTEEIDYNAAAREAASSSYHFQRVFSILCGYTLGGVHSAAAADPGRGGVGFRKGQGH